MNGLWAPSPRKAPRSGHAGRSLSTASRCGVVGTDRLPDDRDPVGPEAVSGWPTGPGSRAVRGVGGGAGAAGAESLLVSAPCRAVEFPPALVLLAGWPPPRPCPVAGYHRRGPSVRLGWAPVDTGRAGRHLRQGFPARGLAEPLARTGPGLRDSFPAPSCSHLRLSATRSPSRAAADVTWARSQVRTPPRPPPVTRARSLYAPSTAKSEIDKAVRGGGRGYTRWRLPPGRVALARRHGRPRPAPSTSSACPLPRPDRARLRAYAPSGRPPAGACRAVAAP